MSHTTPTTEIRRCRAHVRSDGSSEPSWLTPGERVLDQVEADAWRFLPRDVPYDQQTFLFGGPVGWTASAIASAIGNRRTREAARREAEPQWRHLGCLDVIVTTKRLLVNHGGQWWPIWFDVVDRCDVDGDTSVLTFAHDAPYCLRSDALASMFSTVGSGARRRAG